tara:strand:- start:7849 stop:8094 length:246 start_codon:yes stop_codon:yes gene_type:complete
MIKLSPNQNLELRITVIRDTFGELLNLAQVAEVFKYSTVDAVRKAHSRGSLPVKLYKFQRKEGLFAKADEVAKAIESMPEA